MEIEVFDTTTTQQQQNLFGTDTRGALFLNKRKYRLMLFRIWNDALPKVMFIGLNPSTANENTDDNTIKKLRKIAAHNGFGGFYMLNLFTLVSKKPEVLLNHPQPNVGNDVTMKQYSKYAQKIVFCWGAFKQAKIRCDKVIKQFPRAWCLDRNADGSPKHPLYCLDRTTLRPFKK